MPIEEGKLYRIPGVPFLWRAHLHLQRPGFELLIDLPSVRFEALTADLNLRMHGRRSPVLQSAVIEQASEVDIL